jgi:His-Xaa-Ser system radical SAM maturase HxsC
MCSQPPRDADDGWLLDEIDAALELVDIGSPAFTFTGGEPLLEWRKFTGLLARCRELLPTTAVHVLTNGRAFAQREITSAWALVGHPRLMAGIPIYSAVDHVHDYVVQASGAFDETVLGILRLKEFGQRVEVRVVLHAITASRIVETCQWIARNLPFIDHVALMGLENTGFALANDSLIWIDPVDYQNDLERAVANLAGRVPVSVYNLPRCVLPKSVWPFAVQSISDWKNGYVDECKACLERPRCAGFFTTGRPKKSRGISPILAA